MRALKRSFKLRSYSHTALIYNNGTVIQGVSLECNMFNPQVTEFHVVSCRQREHSV